MHRAGGEWKTAGQGLMVTRIHPDIFTYYYYNTTLLAWCLGVTPQTQARRPTHSEDNLTRFRCKYVLLGWSQQADDKTKVEVL